jgi:hypothetical protein
MLVLCGPADPTADAVMDALASLDAPTLRMDIADFPGGATLAAEFDGSGWTGTFGTANLTEVRAVYYWRPSMFRFPDGLSPGDVTYATAEARHGVGGLLASLDVLWVNDPIRVAVAEYKPLQLVTAARCGMRVPATVVTNDVELLRDFAERIDGPVVCKSLSGLVLSEEKVPHLTFTTVVIHGGSEAARVDWRSDYRALTYEVVDVPAGVATTIGRYLAAFGLRYAGFDFAVTPSGEWVFLEANPAGQWLWLELETGAPIAAAHAELLAKGVAR